MNDGDHPRHSDAAQLAAVREAIDCLSLAWSDRPPTDATFERRGITAFAKLEAAFPGHPDPVNLMANGITIRSPEAALADLRQTGPFEIRHPLLERLWNNAGPIIADDEPCRFRFDPIGLILPAPPLRCGGYDASPLNGVCFARTGGGDHFSLLPVGGVVQADSPVVLTLPELDENFVIARDLRKFLRVGLHCGFFQYLENFNPQYAEREGWWFGDEVESEQEELLQSLAEDLDIEPLSPTAIDRSALDAEFGCQLRLGANRRS